MCAQTLPLLLALAAACGEDGPAEPAPPPELAVEVVVEGLEDPVWLTAPAGDPRLFVVERPGRIRVVAEGELLPAPFLDLTGGVRSTGAEQGLFSVAFHPRYAANGFLYVDYTDLNGDTRVERYTVSGDPDVADPASAATVLFVDQPFANHNGGLLLFGEDGMLYVGLGDGGSGGDPRGHGQDSTTLLGSILRLDVDGAAPYAVPPDNPFVGDPAARGEIWAYGLRNPWRFAFDRAADVLLVADVGQNEREEVNAVPAARAGVNYGWNIMEGKSCFAAAECDRSGLTEPVLDYGHSEGCSVTGGFVYRGSAIQGLGGHYFYSDFCAGFLRSFRLAGGAAVEAREWDVGPLGQVLSFGEDPARELYILSRDGTVRRLIASE